MSRKQTLGFCIFFNNDHYYIPWGKMDQSPDGDGYLGLGNKGEHISFHNSGQIHYKDEEGNIELLNKPGSIKFFINLYRPVLEFFKETTFMERKVILSLLKFVQPAIKEGGCFDPSCKNRLGTAIKMDLLVELTVEYFNDNKKMLSQVMGPFDGNYDPDEDEDNYEDEYIEDKEYDKRFSELISSKVDVEEIPPCRYCNGKENIWYNKKKKRFYWRKCPRCGGLGMELERLEKYRT